MEWVEFIGHRYNGSTMTVVFATSMFGVSLGAFAVMVRFFELRLRLESEVLSDSAKAQRSSQRTLVKATNSKTDVYANGVQFVVAVMLFVPLVLMATANLIPLFLYLQPVDALASFSCSQMNASGRAGCECVAPPFLPRDGSLNASAGIALRGADFGGVDAGGDTLLHLPLEYGSFCARWDMFTHPGCAQNPSKELPKNTSSAIAAAAAACFELSETTAVPAPLYAPRDGTVPARCTQP